MTPEQIDWEESSRTGRVSVKSGIDQELDELRRAHAGLPSLLVTSNLYRCSISKLADLTLIMKQSRVASEIGGEIPPGFSPTLSVVYFPQLGYLINIPYSEGVTDPERCESIGWEFQVSRRIDSAEEKANFDFLHHSSSPSSSPTSRAINAEIWIIIWETSIPSCWVSSLLACSERS